MKTKDKLALWLIVLVSVNLLIGLVTAALLTTRGETFAQALGETALGPIVHLFRPWFQDSWSPMFKAYRRKIESPDSDLFSIFFVDHVKFQYPPSSLLFFDLFPSSATRPVNGEVGPALLRWLRWSSMAALLVTIVASGLVLEIGAGYASAAARIRPRQLLTSRFAIYLALGLTYFPLTLAHVIGQIQVFLDAFVAVAILLYLRDKKGWAGACIGICCLVKPQCAVVLLWAALRREWKLAAWFLAVLVPGLVISVLCYGLHDHLRYLDVLKMISRQGESFWLNQSVNGLMNRLLGNGSPLSVGRRPTDFAPYHPLVYALTQVSSLLILALALWPPGKSRGALGPSIDFGIVLAASAMASPVAWNHHYGIFLPIFALAVAPLERTAPLGKATMPLLAVSYIAMSNEMLKPEIVFTNPWLGLAGSHLFYGAVIFFALLLALRAKESTRAPRGNPELAVATPA
jgi:alpha-1,2-mannosyltransferase